MTKYQQSNKRFLSLIIAIFVSFWGITSLHAQSTYPVGALPKAFSVSDSTSVFFSQGNLQYIGSAETPYWKFADHQWDFLAWTTGQNSSDQNVDRDLFGWGTSGYNHGAVCYQPWSTNQTSSDYYAYGNSSYNLYDQTGQADWGYNAISNGGNQEDSGWRTLTHEEWEYLFNTRSTPSGIRYAKAKVNNVNGVILLPDDWNASYYRLIFTNSQSTRYTTNFITATQWAILEQHGAVFLPAAGFCDWTSISYAGSYGLYWSSSYSNSNGARTVYFYDSNLLTGGSSERYRGQSVRLVFPSQGYSFAVNASPSPAEGGAVSGAGAYQAGAECTLTATASAGYVFVNWTENGAVVSTSVNYTFVVLRDRNLVANFIPTISEGGTNGVFSVNANGGSVVFSQGNLQYIGSASTPYWKFAEHQWDYLGPTTGQGSSDQNADRDLFGWGTSGYNHGANNYQPWSMSQTNSDYWAYGNSSYNLFDQTGQADWGCNAISNGGNQEDCGWRTLTKLEWHYLFNTRSTPSGIRYAKAQVNNVNGVILLPDDWNASYYTLNNTNSQSASYTSNTITETQWATLEQHGAVFLPAAGYRYVNSVYFANSYGYYWSSSYVTSGLTGSVYFYDSNFEAGSVENRFYGLSVRLVFPSQGYSFAVNASPSSVEGGAVSGAGDYYYGSTCMLTATANPGYTFINWTCNGEIVSTEPNYSFTVTGAGAYVAHFEWASFTQTIAFPITGTSTSFWFSTYIEMDPVELLEALEDALGENGNEIKYKSSVTSWDEEEEEWDGGLQAVGITNDKTYMIKTNAAVTVTLEGPASNPEDYEILLYPGWNWIGFPCAMEVDIEDAFANFIPMAGDQIKSKDAVAAWDEEEEEWSGSMSKLIPGTGYMFYNAGNTTRTLTFQKGTAKAK